MKLRNVNTTDIGAAIQAGARTMASVFTPDDDDVPFFRSEVCRTRTWPSAPCTPRRTCPDATSTRC